MIDKKSPLDTDNWTGWKEAFIYVKGEPVKVLVANYHGTGLMITMDRAYANRTPPSR